MISIVLLSPAKELLLGELRALRNEIHRLRSRDFLAVEGSDRSEHLKKRIEQARDKLDALRKIERKEKMATRRRREIDRENTRNGAGEE